MKIEPEWPSDRKQCVSFTINFISMLTGDISPIMLRCNNNITVREDENEIAIYGL